MGSLQNQNISLNGRKADAKGGSSPRAAAQPEPIRSREEHLRKLAAEFNAMLDRCLSGAGVEEVHRVRTGSRRVQALVKTILREAGAGSGLKKPAQEWLEPVKDLRRTAGPVRDLDVHRKMIEEASAKKQLASLSVPEASLPRGAAESAESEQGSEERSQATQQIQALDRRLSEKRHRLADALTSKIAKAQRKLADREGAFFAALDDLHPHKRKTPRPASLLALEDFARAANSMPLLDAGNLHEFRKLTKKARYVAESGDEARSKAIAKALKRIQDAIGDWHDWMGLTAEAKSAHPEDAPQLIAWLEHKLDRSFLRALRITGRTRADLLEKWIDAKDANGRRKSGARRPPSRAAGNARSANAAGVRKTG
ncbi:MAG TPA: CHAD domain-containing protein [Acidobacteriaceae bacterium]|nr:CHAD domain-containing protein [Acidobacteriaceae bacterium]